MSTPPRRGTGPLERPRGTGSLDAFQTSPKSHASLDGGSGTIRREPLEEVIREAEALILPLRPRFGALSRALSASAASQAELATLFAGVSDGERAFTMQLAHELKGNPEAERKARIAEQQYQRAETELKTALRIRERFQAHHVSEVAVPGFSPTKFRGMLYPLSNLALHFAGLPKLERLFPVARSQVQTQPLQEIEPSPVAKTVLTASWWQRILDMIRP